MLEGQDEEVVCEEIQVCEEKSEAQPTNHARIGAVWIIGRDMNVG